MKITGAIEKLVSLLSSHGDIDFRMNGTALETANNGKDWKARELGIVGVKHLSVNVDLLTGEKCVMPHPK